ncbi:DMT family transporter [Aestuariirhabdus litorea]|uniref:DMT family transporter n=1 Tax=Aestuariirhabdus litorea TaxID=2528527 RepID=A0A3P3VQG2_9GAMM|nr:DMT family transporter [Aestuariirhabdus litorea]RRJ85022.1 DMT family transporter [Aestuariirhabdus litorea]RWW98247.1 DMT family transporter [Endozoicomonadaceae bacterium GTF-13]
MDSPQRLRLVAYTGLIIATLSWAGNALVGKYTAGSIPPMTLSMGRWSLALIILLPIAGLQLWQHRAVVRQYFWKLLLLSILSITCYNSFLYIAVQKSTAINITLITTAMPIAAIAFAYWILGERPRLKQVSGVLLSLVGLLILISEARWQRLAGLEFQAGDLVMTLATVCWALYSILLKKFSPPLPPATLLLTLILMGTPVIAPFYYWESLTSNYTASLDELWVFAYVAVLPSIVAYLCWNNGVKTLGSTVPTLFSYLIPIFTILLAIPLLGEQLFLYHAVGGALTFAGLYLSTRS